MLSAAGIVALAAGGGTAIATNSEAPSGAPLSVPPTASIDSADLATFAALRRPQTASDQFPTQLVVAGPSGANAALARRVHGFSQGAWLVPGHDALCIFAQGGGACEPSSAATAGELVEISGNRSTPGVEFLSGVVPDGVDQVTARRSDGTVETLPVHENVYMDSVHGLFVSVSFKTASNTVAVQIERPPAAAGLG
ncbi:MAG TPA: hypothetical protein VII01_07345 [Solirubrobacteraceae bacterium]|jgi:hypothetical protein